MVDEARIALETYFPDDVKAMYKGDIAPVTRLLEVICSGEVKIVDNPDIVAVLGERLVIVEHFEFDSFKCARKGSKSRIELARIDRVTESITPTERGVIYHEQIRGISTLEDYEKNAIAGFNKHYVKINQYKRRVQDLGLSTKNQDIKTVFLIEDKTPIGSIAYDGSNMNAITLAEDKEFLIFYKEKPEVDYVIACSTIADKQFVWIIAHCQIQEYLNSSVDYQHMKFLNSTPHFIGANILLPRFDELKPV